MAHTLLWEVVLLFLVGNVGVAVNVGDNDHFCGGTMNFEFIESGIGRTTYTARITVITSWVLGLGPCGPNCTKEDIGQPTKDRRIQICQRQGDNSYFGNWTKEQMAAGDNSIYSDLTDYVTNALKGRVSAVSVREKLEQEILIFDIPIDPELTYTDIKMSGHFWKSSAINLNGSHLDYSLQTKIHAEIRNDTGQPNNSPLALFKPMYRVQLDRTTSIHLTTSDKDGDLVRCSFAQYASTNGMSSLPWVTVTQDCVVQVTPRVNEGLHDGDWGIVALVLIDFNRYPIRMGTFQMRSYYPLGLSETVLNFAIETVQNLTVPEFVEPTQESGHVHTVYAGAILSIPLYAKPSNDSMTSVTVEHIEILLVPDHAFNTTALSSDATRSSQRVVFTIISWQTVQSDFGNYIIQAVAIDSDGYESMDRTFVIEIIPSKLQQDFPDEEKPYFPFFPEADSLTCTQGSTCSFPVYAAPGVQERRIVKVDITKSDIPGTTITSGQMVNHAGQDAYWTDVLFYANSYGQFNICLEATDDQGATREKCCTVTVKPSNPCDDEPCGTNSSECIAQWTNFTCVCKPSFTGALCQTWVDPCLENPSPCQNGATCRSIMNLGFACLCPTGFTGQRCEINIDDCRPGFCLNNGLCVDGINQATCLCRSGFTGDNCSGVPPACNNTTCRNGGVCAMNNNTPECKCPMDTQGSFCETHVSGIPLNSTVNTSLSHAVMPTPRTGLEIVCNVMSTCQIPMYISGGNGSSLQIRPGLSSPGVKTDISNITQGTNGSPGTFSSVLSVTPQEAGNQHVCVDVQNSDSVESLCYTIVSQTSKEPKNDPHIQSGKSMFTNMNLPNGSQLLCLEGQPCHLMLETSSINGNCIPVQVLSADAIAFPAFSTGNSTCATDILLEPETSPASVCLRAGIGGEIRCLTVNTLQSDPCESNPCMNDGQCINSPSVTSGFQCACHVPHSGLLCREVGHCAEGRCLNNAVCVEDGLGLGFHCICLPGYGTEDCRQVPQECRNNICSDPAICLEVGNKTECNCPLGKGGATCNLLSVDTPVNSSMNTNQPHAVLPTPVSGTQFVCHVGSSCSIPIYVRGSANSQTVIRPGLTSPEIDLTVSPPTPDLSSGLPDTLMSFVTFNPKEAGNQHLCVEIGDGSSGNFEHICYTVVSDNVTDSSISPLTSLEGDLFTGSNPSNGSSISCRHGIPCHLIVETTANRSVECLPVRPQSSGVHTFPTSLSGNGTCTTDVLFNPDVIMGSEPVCLEIGFGGERRCYSVNTIDDKADPCNSSPCVNGGVCINTPSELSAFVCACPVPYRGQNCSEVGHCQEGICLNGGVCKEVNNTFYCECQPGFTGDNCRYVPDECARKGCRGNAVCVVVNGHAICQCPLGRFGEICQLSTRTVLQNGVNQIQSQIVAPTFTNGSQIVCVVGTTCVIPIYLTNQSGSHTQLQRGPSSSSVSTVISPLRPDNSTGLPDILQSQVKVTPTEPGIQQVCFTVNNSGEAESICYSLISQLSTGVSTTTAIPSTLQTGGRFTENSLPGGSHIMCLERQPCHLVTHTTLAPNGECIQVNPKVPGVQAFPAVPVDNNSCATDILLDPRIIIGDNVCLEVGFGGEERCFTLGIINSTNDPCTPNPCINGGLCVTIPQTADMVCSCPVPFTGIICEKVGSCSDSRCSDTAVCVNTENGAGFSCNCLSGYSGDDCRNVPEQCDAKQCDDGSLCVIEKGQASCKCPVGRTGDKCDITGVSLSLNSSVNSSQPHLVSPTPLQGLQIVCSVGASCNIPIYVTNPNSTLPPRLISGIISPEVNASISSKTGNVSGVPGVMSVLTITPTTPGEHYVCIDVQDVVSDTTSDNICYTIMSQIPPATNTSGVPQVHAGQFTANNLPNGSQIACPSDQSCHVFVQTIRNASGSCIPVQQTTQGIYKINTVAIDNQTCITDVFIDHASISDGDDVCFKDGTRGELCCYKVNYFQDNICAPTTCQNGGHCIYSPTYPDRFICACPATFQGHLCENETIPSADRCSNGVGVFKRAASQHKVQCTCYLETTNRTYTVIKPRASSQRLFTFVTLSTSTAFGIMLIAWVIFFFVRRAQRAKRAQKKTSTSSRSAIITMHRQADGSLNK